MNLFDFFQKVNKDSGIVGASSIILKDNKIVKEMCYGKSSVEKDTDCTVDTVYRIASVSKLIVATAMMTVVEKGLADIEEDISKYLGFEVRNPKYPNDIINLRMIMTQTSSISDGFEEGYTNTYDSGYNKIICEDEITPLYDVLNKNGKRFVNETFNDYAPGTHWEYSNFGCGIMACIIEKITGIKFTKYVRDNVLLKLGCDASFDCRDIINKDIASTYVQRNGKLELKRTREFFIDNFIKDRGLGNNYVGPAGGLFISVKDLSKIMYAYMNDGVGENGARILEKETMDRMLEMTWMGEAPGDYTAKGLQFQILDYFSNSRGTRRLYGHFGDAYGVKSFFLFNPWQKLGFVYILNGGFYKYQECGICDVHEKLLERYVDEYWDESLKHHFYFKSCSETGILDGRTIHLKYNPPKRQTLSKRPYLNKMTVIDCLNLPMNIDKKKVLEGFDVIDEAHLFEVLMLEGATYWFDPKIKEYDDDANTEIDIEYGVKERTKSHLIANFHTHLEYCHHAIGMPIDYAASANDMGYETLGISDHGPVPNSFVGRSGDGTVDNVLSYEQVKGEYLEKIEEARKAYPNMNIQSALEIEYVEGHDDYYKDLLSGLDYLILGAHFVMLDGKVINAYRKINSENVIEYAKVVEKALNTKMFKIIAHPDIFMFRYVSSDGVLRKFDENARIASNIIIDAAIRNDVLIEYNVGGLGRGKMEVNDHGDISYHYVYSREEFFKIVKEKNGKTIIGCDAHNPYSFKSNAVVRAIENCEDIGLEPVNVRK